MIFFLTISLAFCISISEIPFKTIRPFSGFFPILPIAAAMEKPDIPVPGIPTFIPFFRIYELTIILIFCTSSSKTAAAYAAARATAPGSVHPSANDVSS